MRVIKPGKLGGGLAPEKKSSRREQKPSAPQREIWDDFAPVKKGRRKKEYEKDNEGRFVHKSAKDIVDSRGDAEANAAERADIPLPEELKPRTDYAELQGKLGYEFGDQELLERALTHRSALGFQERLDYERLEFLGDAVFDLTVAHLLSIKHPNAREGELSKMRAALVNTSALANVARELEIGRFIKLGKGELVSGGSDRPSILADVMEALVGAMYLDSTYDKTFAVIEAIYGESLEEVSPSDPKTELQEALHLAGSEPPTYLLELVEGPEHAPTFITVVVVDGEIAGRGRGNTKKAAQQDAAAEALGKLTSQERLLECVEDDSVFLRSALLTAPLFGTENNSD